MRATLIIAVIAGVSCAPAPEQRPEPSSDPHEAPLPGRVDGAFYPTWDVGTKWTVIDDEFEEKIMVTQAGPEPSVPVPWRSGYGMKVEWVDERGTAHLTFWDQPEPPLGPEVYEHLEIDRSGTVTLVDSRHGRIERSAEEANAPYGHPEQPASTIRVARVWPLFPLEPGLRVATDGSWTQAVRADGDARIVTIAFRDGLGRGQVGEMCPAVVIQRWEPGRPIWSSRVGAGCNGAWNLGKLLGRYGEGPAFDSKDVW